MPRLPIIANGGQEVDRRSDTESQQLQHDVTERTPLIGDLASQEVPRTGHQQSRKVIWLLCLSILMGASAGGFAMMPLTQLLEDAVCREQGQDTALVPHLDDCKSTWVQSRVAYLLAISGTCDAICGFSAALPWGIVADRIGRKPVVALALTGGSLVLVWWMIVLAIHPALPLWTGWFGAMALFIGGGVPIMNAAFFGIISDTTNEDGRSLAFMRIHVVAMLGNLVSPGLASVLMNLVGPWPLLWVAVVLLLSAGIPFIFIPETLRADPQVETKTLTFAATLANARQSLSLLKSPWLAMLLLTSLLTQPITPATSVSLPQFVSKRYDIKVQNTGYVQTVSGAVQVFMVLLGLPILSRYILAPRTSGTPWKIMHADNEQRRDLILARFSFILVILGTLVLAAALSLGTFVLGLVVLSLGSGYSSYTRALMSLYVDKEQTSTLFSLVAMLDVLGAIYAGVSFAKLFSVGMDHGGIWVGLPFFVLAIVTTVAIVPLFLLRLPKAESKASSNDSMTGVET
ncbi:hypothetical protein CERZMDRAFT_93267 [Cercospora zeae-maydis SCOH1-5]|uniref:Major facilitator superfamily (MFS) profile domain-containing protein n=1 Tax=Cercospora zeae-maydis SCOH1-5 TaxID=717836 RepID=A0A6A6FUM9_9PEZI|nr:hypothetical protein CERZMDRAFT_93267 [Cercospora zeae-maydis SCOH1-5]